MTRMKRWLAGAAMLLISAPAPAGQRFDVRTFAVGDAPEKPIAVPEWGRVFVPLGHETRIAVIDSAKDELSGYIETRAHPDRLAFDLERNRLVAVMAGWIEVFAPRGMGYERVALIQNNLIDLAHSAELNQVKGELIITDRHRVGTLDLATLTYVESPDDLAGVNQMVIEPAIARVIVAEEESHLIVALSSDLARRELAVRNWAPSAVGYSPLRDRIYAVSPQLRLVQIIDPATGNDEHALVDGGASSLIVDDARGAVWVGHNASASVVRVRTDTRESKFIPIPGHGWPILLDGEAGKLYALEQDGSRVSLIGTASERFEAAYAVGLFPRYGVVDPRSHKLYTSNLGDGTVSILRPLPDPDRSEFVVSLEYIAADERSTSRATVRPRDSDGAPLGPGHDVVIETSAGTLLGKVIDQLDGTYTQDLLSSSTTETGILSAIVDGVRIRPRPRVSFTRTGWPNARLPEPEWGLTSGHERVTILGDGFASQFRGLRSTGSAGLVVDVRVEFDGIEAAVESFTDTEIVCWTPPHAVGVVDIAVIKFVGDERRESFLRQGFTYTKSTELKLHVAAGKAPDSIQLVWSDGPSGPVKMLRSSAKDFSSDLVSVAGLNGPSTEDIAPAFPRVQYYRIER